MITFHAADWQLVKPFSRVAPVQSIQVLRKAHLHAHRR